MPARVSALFDDAAKCCAPRYGSGRRTDTLEPRCQTCGGSIIRHRRGAQTTLGLPQSHIQLSSRRTSKKRELQAPSCAGGTSRRCARAPSAGRVRRASRQEASSFLALLAARRRRCDARAPTLACARAPQRGATTLAAPRRGGCAAPVVRAALRAAALFLLQWLSITPHLRARIWRHARRRARGMRSRLGRARSHSLRVRACAVV